MLIGSYMAPSALCRSVQSYHSRRARGHCWGSTGCRETLEVCEARGTRQALCQCYGSLAQLRKKERLRNQQVHSGRRQLEQKPIVKFYLIKQIKRGATRTYRVTKPILSNCLHGSKTSLTGITSNTYKSATISKPQFQEFGNKYLLTGQPTHTVSKIKILNVTMKKTSS